MATRATCPLFYYHSLRFSVVYLAVGRSGRLQNRLHAIFSLFGNCLSIIVECLASYFARFLASSRRLLDFGGRSDVHLSIELVYRLLENHHRAGQRAIGLSRVKKV